MTALRWVRRFAAVICNPLKLLVRRFGAAVRTAVAAVPKKLIKSKCGGVRRMGWSAPPYPLWLRGALERAASAWKGGDCIRENPCPHTAFIGATS
jgi:hypothetical protein